MRSNPPHPWRVLRKLPHVVVSWRDDMPPGMRGASNGNTMIWMRRGMLQTQRRCTLAHELAHLHLGHTSCQDERTETRVRRLVATWLIPFDHLLTAAAWAHNHAELADELWVTEDVLTDRLRWLTDGERRALGAVHSDLPTEGRNDRWLG